MDEGWRVKACLWNIDKYRDSLNQCSDKIKNIIINVYDYKLCSYRCVGGAEFTLGESKHKKCAGCCFYFYDLNSNDWLDLLMLIQKEHEVSV